MASVSIKRGTKEEIDATNVNDGQILFTTDQAQNKIYADVGETRKQIGGTVEIINNLTSNDIDKALSANMGKTLSNSSNISYSNSSSGLSATNVQSAIDELKIEDSAYSHNGIYRGKDITSDYDSGVFSTNVANGTFKNIFIGDYITKSITVDGTTYTGKWLIADLDYFYNKGDSACTTHHAVLIPDFNIGTSPMNNTDTTVGGYVGSKMYTETLPKYLSAIRVAFGSSHIVKHRSLFSNGINASGYNRLGFNGGCSNNWVWCDSYIELMSEIMVYGSIVWSSSGFDTGSSNNQLAIFRLNTSQNNFDRNWFWLKDIASSSFFCNANTGGDASYNSASHVTCVRPLVLLS